MKNSITSRFIKAISPLLLFVLIASCTDEKDTISYTDIKFTHEMDSTSYQNVGEKRTVNLELSRRKSVNGVLTDTWEACPGSIISVSTLHGIFEAKYSPEEGNVQLSVNENPIQDGRTDSLIIQIDEAPMNLTLYFALKQDASVISFDYKIASEQNPFTIPVGGGEFYIPFTCMCQKTINGKAAEWEYSDMKRLRYGKVTSRPDCSINIEATDKVGHYKFHLVINDPFDLVDGRQPLFQYVIRTQLFEYPQVEYLNQSLIPERFDPKLEYDLYGVVSVSGPIEI